MFSVERKKCWEQKSQLLAWVFLMADPSWICSYSFMKWIHGILAVESNSTSFVKFQSNLFCCSFLCSLIRVEIWCLISGGCCLVCLLPISESGFVSIIFVPTCLLLNLRLLFSNPDIHIPVLNHPNMWNHPLPTGLGCVATLWSCFFAWFPQDILENLYKKGGSDAFYAPWTSLNFCVLFCC